MIANRPPIHFFNLDILRALAVIMVVVFHGQLAYSGWFHEPTFMTNPFSGKLWEHFFSNLSLGVDFFFLISGFLITYLLLMEKESEGEIAIGKFYVRRILRIWPLYFLVIACTPLICKLADSSSPHYLGTLFFVNNFQTIHLGFMDYPFVHFWTLSIEEQYYLVWPLVLAFVPEKKLPNIFIALALIALLYKLVVVAVAANPMLVIQYDTLSRGDAIIAGAFLAWLHHRKPLTVHIAGWVRILVYILLVAGMFLLQGISSNSLFGLVFAKYFFLAGFIFILLNYLFNPSAIAIFTKKNFLHYIGKISFGIYVFHNIILPIMIKRLLYKWGAQNAFVFWLVYIVLVLLASVLSYELFEKRILRFKERFSILANRR